MNILFQTVVYFYSQQLSLEDCVLFFVLSWVFPYSQEKKAHGGSLGCGAVTDVGSSYPMSDHRLGLGMKGGGLLATFGERRDSVFL